MTVSLPSIVTTLPVVASALISGVGLVWWVPSVASYYGTTYFAPMPQPNPPLLNRTCCALVVFVLSWALASSVSLWSLPWLTLIGVALAGVVVVDTRYQVIPDRFQILGLCGVVGLIFVESEEHALARAVVGVSIATALWIVTRIYERVRRQEAVGFGDIKLLAWLGVLLGGDNLWVITIGTCVAAVTILPLVLLGYRKADEPFAFGPFLVIGALALFAHRAYGPA